MNSCTACAHREEPQDWRNIDHFSIYGEEGVGANKKLWLESDCSQCRRRGLFKPRRDRKSNLEPNAEYAAGRIAKLLGVPSAEIELVTYGGERGCLSWQVVPPHEERLDGTAVLREIGVVTDAADRLRRGHSANLIAKALREVKAPPGQCADEGLTAIDVFVGYLVLDALIGNRDRHADNWAVSRNTRGGLTLLPSFDHASSFGISERELGAQRLSQDDLAFEKYRNKGVADRFEDGMKVRLVTYACLAIDGHASTSARSYWAGALLKLELDDLERSLSEAQFTPRAYEFARKLLFANLEELRSCLI